MLRPEVSAGCLFDALHDFLKANNNTTHVKEVRLIIYGGQKEMHQPIMEALHKKVKELQESGTLGFFKSCRSTYELFIVKFLSFKLRLTIIV